MNQVQVQDSAVTKDDIIDYIDTMKIKKSRFSGLDRVDVYIHIQELVKLYGIYAAQEVSRQREKLDQLEMGIGEGSFEDVKEYQERIKALIGENRELQQQKRILDEKIAEQRKKIKELHLSDNSIDSSEILEELEQSKADTQELMGQLEQCQKDQEKLQKKLDKSQKEVKELNREITELKEYKSQALRLQDELKKVSSSVPSVEVDSYKNIISQLQQEKLEQNQRIEELKGYEVLASQLQSEADRLQVKMQAIQQAPPTFSSNVQQFNPSQMQEKPKQEDIYDQMLKKLENKPLFGGSLHADTASIYRGKELDRELVLREQAIEEKEKKMEAIMGHLENIVLDARKEGQSIIDGARIEAEHEIHKLDNLRETYRKELEKYNVWFSQVELEKKSVEGFMEQLSKQYELMNQEFVSVKERANSFDINRVLHRVDERYDDKKDLA